MSQTIKTQIELSGLTCNACEKIVTKRLSKIGGVTQVKVNLNDETAEVEGLRKLTQVEVKNILADTHYKVISVH